MKLMKRLVCGMVLFTMLLTPTTISAQSVSDSRSSRGCSTGGCCGARSGNSRVLSPPDVALTTVSPPVALERLSLRMLSVMRSELQGAREYKNLMADAGDVVRAAQRLRQSESRRASRDVLLDDARTMLTPLSRMNAALGDEAQARDSRQAVHEVGSVLIAFGRDLQNTGSEPARPNRNLSPPPRSMSYPGGSQGVAIPEQMQGIALLPANQQQLALNQRTCPVTGEPLGSMGKPIRVDVSGRSIYVCCAGCVSAVKRNPEKYLM